MTLSTRHPWLLLSMLVVPLLTLASPAWLRIYGIPPAWAPLWLLPWALVDGQLSGSVAGLCLGLLLDSLHPGPVSAIPALLLLGWWWGRLGYQGPPIERSFNLALLAMIGTLGLNLSLMAQWAWRSWFGLRGLQESAAARLALPGWHGSDLALAGVQVLLSQLLLAALMAPVICSLLLLLFRRLQSASGRG
jgi:hypothetical protein